MLCPIVLKVSTLVHYGSVKAAEWLKSTSGQIKDGGRHPNRKWLNRNNLTVDCPILFKFGRLVHYGLRAEGKNDWRDGAASSGNAALIATFSIYLYFIIWFTPISVLLSGA